MEYPNLWHFCALFSSNEGTDVTCNPGWDFMCSVLVHMFHCNIVAIKILALIISEANPVLYSKPA
jgi:hypothetical protein